VKTKCPLYALRNDHFQNSRSSLQWFSPIFWILWLLFSVQFYTHGMFINNMLLSIVCFWTLCMWGHIKYICFQINHLSLHSTINGHFECFQWCFLKLQTMFPWAFLYIYICKNNLARDSLGVHLGVELLGSRMCYFQLSL
jgi:hypothetical protein